MIVRCLLIFIFYKGNLKSVNLYANNRVGLPKTFTNVLIAYFFKTVEPDNCNIPVVQVFGSVNQWAMVYSELCSVLGLELASSEAA